MTGEQLALTVDDDLLLLGRLAAEVRRRQHEAMAVERRWREVTKANAAAAERRSAAVTAVRDLLGAMTDGAGSDGRVDLAAARAAALAVLAEAEP